MRIKTVLSASFFSILLHTGSVFAIDPYTPVDPNDPSTYAPPSSTPSGPQPGYIPPDFRECDRWLALMAVLGPAIVEDEYRKCLENAVFDSKFPLPLYDPWSSPWMP